MRIFSYWSGPITWIERLSAASAVATGHELTIFADEPRKLTDEGLGVHIEDAREVLDDPTLFSMNRRLAGHYSDHFRVEGLAKDLDIWCDLDMLFLKTLPNDEYVLGWEVGGMVSGAVLRLPNNSPMLSDYLIMCRRRPLPIAPLWISWQARAMLVFKHWRRRARGHRGIRPPYGPPALTHLVSLHHINCEVAPREKYHPLDPDQIPGLAARNDFEPDPRTHTIHLFGSHFRDTLGGCPPMPGSWLAQKNHELAL
jgi:hypothetical protein